MSNRSDTDLITQLQALLPGQFDYVVARFGMPKAFLSEQVSQTTKAIELIQYARQFGGGETRLQALITQAQQLTTAGEIQTAIGSQRTKSMYWRVGLAAALVLFSIGFFLLKVINQNNDLPWVGVVEGNDCAVYMRNGDINLVRIQQCTISEASYTRLEKKYDITRLALESFFRTLQQQDVPAEQIDSKLAEIVKNHKKLLVRLDNLKSQDPEIGQLTQQVREALENGRYSHAENLLNQAHDRVLAVIEVLEKGTTIHRLSAAAIAATTGKLKTLQLQYAQAVVYFEQAIALLPEGKEKILAEYLNQTGEAYLRAGQYLQAIFLFKKSLILQKKVHGEDTVEIAKGLNNLALSYEHINKHQQALTLYQQALEINEKMYGEVHPDVATNLNNMAVLHKNRGEYAQALPLYQRALKIREKRSDQEPLDLATIMNNLAVFYWVTHDYVEALRLSLQALEIRERELGKEHPHIAISLSNLALVYHNLGENTQALTHAKRALKIFKKVLGEGHPHVASSLNTLAMLYKNKGDYEQALLLYQRALEIREKVLGKKHLDVAQSLNSLATWYSDLGDYEQALPYYRRALVILEAVLEETHPNTQMVRESYEYAQRAAEQ